MSADSEIRRKRLKYRSAHRGMKEMDIVLGRFAQLHVDNLDAAALDRFEAILDEEDPDIHAWLTGRQAVPDRIKSDIFDLLLSFRPADHAS